MLDERQLGTYIDERFDHPGATLFRLETHDHLDVESDQDRMARYLAGEPGPPDRPWLNVIRSEVARGMHTYRVHVVRSPLTPYLRFCFEWGYAQNVAAGEHISIIDLAEQDAPAGLLDHDFWLINDQDVVLMHYDESGRFGGGEPLEDLTKVEAYRRCAATAWDAGVPFLDYWSAHPEAHRVRVPAQRRSIIDKPDQSSRGRTSQAP